MKPKDVADKAKKIIEMYQDTYVYNRLYFNPAYLSDFYSQVPELEIVGIEAVTTETETEEGNIISGKLKSRDRNLDLGSVLLDGVGIVVERDLKSINELLEFIENEIRHLSK